MIDHRYNKAWIGFGSLPKDNELGVLNIKSHLLQMVFAADQFTWFEAVQLSIEQVPWFLAT